VSSIDREREQAFTVSISGTRLALEPGRKALEALGTLVPESATINAAALEMLDPEKQRCKGTRREYLGNMIERADGIRSCALAHRSPARISGGPMIATRCSVLRSRDALPLSRALSLSQRPGRDSETDRGAAAACS
jgi:hypothetical protein